MLFKELIGKEILDIRSNSSDFDYEGSIALKQSHSIVTLKSGEVFEIPYNGATKIYTEEGLIDETYSIFKNQPHNQFHFFLLKLFPQYFSIPTSELETLILGKKIMNFHQTADEDAYMNKIVIELDNGVLFTEQYIEPVGIGAGIKIFNTKEEFEKKYSEELITIF